MVAAPEMTDPLPRPKVTLVPGDGIGPEVVEAATRVIDACVEIDWEVQVAGARAREQGRDSLPEEVVESLRRTEVGLKGPLATSTSRGSPNVALREALDLHTTIRPCRGVDRSRPGPDQDLVIVKMNLEDLYARIGFGAGSPEAETVRGMVRTVHGDVLSGDAAVSIRPISVTGARRTIEQAFIYARTHGRRRVTAVHKAPLIPETDGLFVEVAREVGERYREIEQDDALVDTVCERLVSGSSRYDVLVMPRMYGDIVSGVAATLIGGPGIAPGVNVGEGFAVFEALHGSAPRLAGQGRANPMALILSGALMVRHLGEPSAAERIEAAVATVARARRTVTYDLDPIGSPAGTAEVADAVIAELAQ